jgi:hypothetical protein
MVPIVKFRPPLKPGRNPLGKAANSRSGGATNVPNPPSDDPDFKRGLDLFNQAHFFDAHEVLEVLWRPLPRNSAAQARLRLHVQGMIQLAVAFHHQSTGNRVGALSVLQRALRNLKGAERSFPQFDFDRLRTESALWEQYLERRVAARAKKSGGHPSPALPKIRRRRQAGEISVARRSAKSGLLESSPCEGQHLIARKPARKPARNLDS